MMWRDSPEDRDGCYSAYRWWGGFRKSDAIVDDGSVGYALTLLIGSPRVLWLSFAPARHPYSNRCHWVALTRPSRSGFVDAGSRQACRVYAWLLSEILEGSAGDVNVVPARRGRREVAMTTHRRRRRRSSIDSVTTNGQLLMCRSGSKLEADVGAASDAPSGLRPAAIRLIELIVRDLARIDERNAGIRACKKQR